MDIKQLINDDNGVSPVIGVILMVAITVILAAVIASFVLGLGPDTATTPTATFDSEVTNSGDNFEITMENGEQIDGASIEFTYDLSTNYNVYQTGTTNDIDSLTWDSAGGDSPITAGSSITLDFENSLTSGDSYTIRLIYVDGDTSSTLQTFEGTY